MSEREDPEAKTRKRKRRRRRSLLVPVDEVPRPQAGEMTDAGSATQEMEAYDDEGRVTAPDLHEVGDDESAEREVPEDELEAIEELEENLVGAARAEGSDAPLETEPTVAQIPAPQAAETIGGAAEAHEPESHSLEVDLDEEEARAPVDDAPEPTPAAQNPAPPVAPVVGVIVQRVVAVASPVTSSPPPEEPPHDDEPSLALEIDEEPELRLGEPDAAELEELDVDLEDSAHAAPDPERDSAPELALEDAEALLEEEEAREEPTKRISIRPPPPPSKPKEAPAPTEAPPAPSQAQPAPPPPPEVASAPAAAKKKKPRRHWWEELFNDDYLRTVPIPHPRVIERQCDFIEQRFGLAPGAALLDVGCGLGLHAVELTRRGYLVVGLDLSLSMLARAADEAQDHGFKINFLHADMREMTFEGAFDAVICYGTTFGYFDDETNKQVVDRLYRALKPRGLLLLDVVNRDFVIRNQPNLVWFEGDGCVVMEESQMNYITSRLEVKRTVILDNGRQRDNVYSLRTYSLHELGQILHHQGFRVVEVTGWEAHPGVFFGGDSPKLIILAERRPQGPPTPPGRSPSGEHAATTDSAEPSADEVDGVEEIAEQEPRLHAEPKEPSPAVSAALAEALEQSTELEIEPESDVDEDELDPEELAEEELEEPES